MPYHPSRPINSEGQIRARQLERIARQAARGSNAMGMGNLYHTRTPGGDVFTGVPESTSSSSTTLNAWWAPGTVTLTAPSGAAEPTFSGSEIDTDSFHASGDGFIQVPSDLYGIYEVGFSLHITSLVSLLQDGDEIAFGVGVSSSGTGGSITEYFGEYLNVSETSPDISIWKTAHGLLRCHNLASSFVRVSITYAVGITLTSLVCNIWGKRLGDDPGLT